MVDKTSEELTPAARREADAAADAELGVARFLRSFHLLLRSAGLYQKNHPRILESLEAAGHHLRAALEQHSALAVGVERGTLVVPALHGRVLPDSRGELKSLAEELSRCGVTSLIFLPETNLGELNTLAHLLQATRHRLAALASRSCARTGAAPPRKEDWSAQLAEHHVLGIRVNTRIERKANTVLASLAAALMASGGAPEPATLEPSSPLAGAESDATLDEWVAVLRLFARLVPALERAQQDSPPEAVATFHALLAEADRRSVAQLAGALTHRAPCEGETPETYVARLADELVLEAVSGEFRAGRATPPELRGLFARLSHELAAAAAATPEGAALAARWADEAYAEHVVERFWAELPAREKSVVLRSRDAWCAPVAALRRFLQHLADAGPEASGRQARLVMLNYARCLESEEAKARRAVAIGLSELHPLLEVLWPNQWPEELSRSVLRAVAIETSPGVAGLLAAVTENLARVAVARADFAELERILEALECAPRDSDHAHLAALAGRFVADERWLTLVDAALANRPLDPVLPRLLRRAPDRLLDRLTLLLTAPQGLDALPAMARLLRAIGEPAIGPLETRLLEPRRQRATAAVKLLAAAEPRRLVAALPRALPSWDWHLQDLAVSELARLGTPGTALAFLATVSDAHPMVAPMMLDQISLAREIAAVPLLLEIAAGENERLRDVFLRIKAIEALGRMRVAEAADLLGAILHERNGLTHAEPAGLRAAAEEALALIENRPSSARVRAAYEAVEKASRSFPRPRRYLRIPLSSPFAAHIEGPQPAAARVRTISLGGAFLESSRRLAVGDSLRVEFRTGLRRIQSTAVVRNVAPNGGGIEFVHMTQEDREKLRRLVRRLVPR